jgi:hypothetical protein
MSVLFASRNKDVRAAGQDLAVALYGYLGPVVKTALSKDLKDVQVCQGAGD